MHSGGTKTSSQSTYDEEKERDRTQTTADLHAGRDVPIGPQCVEATQTLSESLDISTKSSPHNSLIPVENHSDSSLTDRLEDSLLPTSQGCQSAIDLFGGEDWKGNYGIIHRFHVTPRGVRLSARNLSGKTESGTPCKRQKFPGRGKAKGFTRRSENRMVQSFTALDFSPMYRKGSKRALLTLTYPGDWKKIVPNGEVALKQLNEFFRKFERAFGQPPRLIYKREFTEKGAPHFHIFLQLPEGTAGEAAEKAYQRRLSEWKAGQRKGGTPRQRRPAYSDAPFEVWAAKVWTNIVNHLDPTQRAKHELHGADVKVWNDADPSTIIAYFSKSRSSPTSSKGYQHRVPEIWKQAEESVRGNWGKRGLQKAEEAVQISTREFHLLARVLRRFKRNVRDYNSTTGDYDVAPALQKVFRPRGPVIGHELDEYGHLQPVQKRRKTTVRRSTTSHTGAGYLIANNGPRVAMDLHRYLVMATAPSAPPSHLPVGLRGPLHERLTRRANPRVGSGPSWRSRVTLDS